MPDFNAKMHHKIDFGSLPRPLAGFNEAYFQGEGRGREGTGGEGALDLPGSSFWQSWLRAWI